MRILIPKISYFIGCVTLGKSSCLSEPLSTSMQWDCGEDSRRHWGEGHTVGVQLTAPSPIPGPLGVLRAAENPSPEHWVLARSVEDQAGVSVTGQLQGGAHLPLPGAPGTAAGETTGRKQAVRRVCWGGGAWDPHRPDRTLQPPVAPVPEPGVAGAQQAQTLLTPPRDGKDPWAGPGAAPSLQPGSAVPSAGLQCRPAPQISAKNVVSVDVPTPQHQGKGARRRQGGRGTGLLRGKVQ